MPETPNQCTPAALAKSRLPWFVCVSPEYYDDACDTGFSWEGWAVDEDEVVLQALFSCHTINDREPDCRLEDVDPSRAEVHVAEIDFRRFAGPLVHWARSMGGWDTPLWNAIEAAVVESGLEIAPLDPMNGGETEIRGRG